MKASHEYIDRHWEYNGAIVLRPGLSPRGQYLDYPLVLVSSVLVCLIALFVCCVKIRESLLAAGRLFRGIRDDGRGNSGMDEAFCSEGGRNPQCVYHARVDFVA